MTVGLWLPGNRYKARMRQLITPTNERTRGAENRSKMADNAKNTLQPASTLPRQPTRIESQLYARQRPATYTIPSIVSCAARAAKVVPRPRARNNATGPDVRGRPTSQPLTAGPQRRPARLTNPSKAGVKSSLNASIQLYPS